MKVGVRTARDLTLEGRARRVHVHRMRPLQGRVSDVPDRQAAVAEVGQRQPQASSARAARCDRRRRRGGAAGAGRRRDRATRRCGRARPAAIARRRARSSSSICRKFFRMRQHQVMIEGEFPHELKQRVRRLRGAEQSVGPAGRHARRLGRTGSASRSCTRAEDVQGSTTCSTSARRMSFDPRGQKIARAFVESCSAPASASASSARAKASTGECVRRVGNEMLFQQLARALVETLDELGVTRIVTCDPHALQLAAQRVSRVRRALRGRAPHAAHRRAARRRAASASTPSARARHLPRPVLPRPAQRRIRGAARDPRAPDARRAARVRAERARSRCAAAPAAAACGSTRRSARASTSPASSRRSSVAADDRDRLPLLRGDDRATAGALSREARRGRATSPSSSPTPCAGRRPRLPRALDARPPSRWTFSGTLSIAPALPRAAGFCEESRMGRWPRAWGAPRRAPACRHFVRHRVLLGRLQARARLGVKASFLERNVIARERREDVSALAQEGDVVPRLTARRTASRCGSSAIQSSSSQLWSSCRRSTACTIALSALVASLGKTWRSSSSWCWRAEVEK